MTTAAHTALTGSVVLAGLLHLGWAEQVDPVAQTLSDSALHEGATRLFTAYGVSGALYGTLAGLAVAGSAASGSPSAPTRTGRRRSRSSA